MKQAKQSAGKRVSAKKGATKTNLNKRGTTSKRDAKARGETSSATASALIDGRIKELTDWRGTTLARLRLLIRQAVPDVIEEWKWSVPVWSSNGIICTGETYKKAVKLTFAKGAALADPARLFNSSLEGNTRRAIDFYEGAEFDERAFQNLVRTAAAHNSSHRA